MMYPLRIKYQSKLLTFTFLQSKHLMSRGSAEGFSLSVLTFVAVKVKTTDRDQ